MDRASLVAFLVWYSAHFSRHSNLTIGEIVDLYLKEKTHG